MRAFKIIFLFLAFAVFRPSTVLAQRNLYNWQVSPYGGFFTLNNDIEVPNSANQYAYGLRLERRLGNDFTFGVNFSHVHFNGASEKDISGGLIGFGYHWDNGYLFSKRSAVSIFHRLEIGYATRKNDVDKLEGSSSDFAFGFENGLKFRLGDRVSAELALEIMGSKASLTEGDIAKNQRYNVWKVGLNYHFGSRKSRFVAPVFVPSRLVVQPREMTEMDSKMAGLWLLSDSVVQDFSVGEMRDTLLLDTIATVQKETNLTRADSLMIFMHFDSLYQRRIAPSDTMKTMVDSLANNQMSKDSLATSEMVADSIETLKAHVNDTLKAHIDTVETSRMLVDSINTSRANADTVGISKARVDSVNNSSKAKTDTVVNSKMRVDSVNTSKAKADTVGTAKMAIDSLSSSKSRTDTVSKPKIRADSVNTSNAKTDTVATASQQAVMVHRKSQRDTLSAKEYKEKVRTDSIITRVDTVYIEKPGTSTQLKSNGESQAGRIDTVYVIQNADASGSSDTKDDEKADKHKDVKNMSDNDKNDSNDELQKSIDRQNKLIDNQTDQIRQNQETIDKLAKKEKNKNLGKILAAGAAGTAVGAIAASGKKGETDTVYVESTATKAEMDSLRREIDRLQGNDTANISYVGGPPIGHYFDNDTLSTDSLYAINDTLPILDDSIFKMNDSIPLRNDSIAHASDTMPTVVHADPVRIDSIPNSSPSGKVESNKPPAENSASAKTELVASYPVVCNFELNSTSLESAGIPQLDQVIKDLENDPERKVLLTGHTDKSGNAAYNLTLSKKRAQSVKEYLTSKGIDSSRISTESKGADDATQNYNKNARRVEIQMAE